MSQQIVTLYAKPRFVTIPREIQSDVIVKYGSFFKEGTRAVARGLSSEEEEYILPSYIDVSPNDVMNWSKATKEFWANLTRSISVKDGATLNITHQVIKKEVTLTKIISGQEVKENKEVEIRIPEVIEDFCIYTLCLMDSRVAVTEEELEVKESFNYYLLDPERVQREKQKAYKIKKDANRIYAEFSSGNSSEEDKAKITQILIMCKPELVDLDAFPIETGDTENDTIEREMAIKVLADEFPEKLVKLYEDSSLAYRATINNMLEKGVITKEGNSFFNEDNEEIAKDYKALVRFIKSTENQPKISKMKAKASIA